jgi:DNA-directed RNA polymerase alpha subunit
MSDEIAGAARSLNCSRSRNDFRLRYGQWPSTPTSRLRRNCERGIELLEQEAAARARAEVLKNHPFNKNLFRRVDGLELSERTANCLKNDNIVYIRDLVQKSEAKMLRMPNFGRKCLNEVKEVLAQMGLWLGMKLSYWSDFR